MIIPIILTIFLSFLNMALITDTGIPNKIAETRDNKNAYHYEASSPELNRLEIANSKCRETQYIISLKTLGSFSSNAKNIPKNGWGINNPCQVVLS